MLISNLPVTAQDSCCTGLGCVRDLLIVKEAPQNEAMQCGREVGKIGCPVPEDSKSNCGLFGNILFIQAEAKHANNSHYEWHECPP